MDVEPGEGWADSVSKILRMGTNNPESNRILSKAKRDQHEAPHSDQSDQSDNENDDEIEKDDKKAKSIDEKCSTKRLKPDAQPDALLENELKEIATRGVVHLFNAVKTVNPKSDKKMKKKKKKKKKKGKLKNGRFRK